MRWLICVLLALISASVAIPTAMNAVGYRGTLGYARDDSGVVTSVAPRGPASGVLRPGDRIDFGAMSWSQRAARPRPGEPVTLPIVRDGKHAVVTMTATLRAPYTPIERAGFWLSLVYDLIVPFIGLFIVLRRPTVLTTALFLTCLGGGGNTYWAAQAAPQFVPLATLIALIAPLSLTTGFVLFCTRFPEERPVGWARIAERILLACTAIGMACYGVVLYGFGASVDSDAAYIGACVAIEGVLLGAYATFAVRRRTFRADERVRGDWVDVGLASYVFAFGVFFALNIFYAADPTAHGIATIVFALQPAPYVMAYALTRARILDLRFVGGRTVFYAVLAAVPIAVLGVIDWLAGRFLASSGATLAVEVAATVAMSFGLNAIHRRAEQFVDRVLFRDRRRGERRLEIAIASLGHAEDENTVSRTLTDDVSSAFALVSAATFVRAENGWRRQEATGWEGCATLLPLEHRLALAARTRTEPLAVDDVSSTDVPPLPSGPGRPDTLVPIAIRHELAGFALYSRTKDGDHLDPLQLEILRRAGEAAALAYERIEIADQRRSIERLRAENDALRERLSLGALTP